MKLVSKTRMEADLLDAGWKRKGDSGIWWIDPFETNGTITTWLAWLALREQQRCIAEDAARPTISVSLDEATNKLTAMVKHERERADLAEQVRDQAQARLAEVVAEKQKLQEDIDEIKARLEWLSGYLK